VEGEVSGYKRAASGHVFFSLKDEKSVIKAVMWQSTARKIAFDLKDGLQVICRGKVSVYEPRGDYQLYVDLVEPKGKGALQLAFEQLKEKLSREGLFDPARKKPLPHLPQKIGIVTSPTGAAIRDILQIIDRRFANVHLLLYPVRVQGVGAAQEIARAIDELGQWPGLDVMIVGRGGGSLEDLWAFNEEPVARAIHRSPVPVVSAVGHEIDFTIADFVADLRAPTPSAAAELVVRNKVELVQTLENLARRLSQRVRMNLEAMQERLSSLVHRLSDPRKRLSDQRLRLDDLCSRLATAIQQSLGRRIDRFRMKVESLTLLHPGKRVTDYSHRLGHLHRRLTVAGHSSMRFHRQRVEVAAGRLHSLSPLGVLERGYGIARVLPSREIIRDASRLRADDRVNVKVHRGEFVARVEKIAGPEEDPQLFAHTFKK
jgi:exodeoxyribonuclease VII large subunit